MTGRLFALAVVVAGLPAGPGLAQPAYYAPCSDRDLTGTWGVEIEAVEAPAAKAFYAAHPNEYLRFGPGGSYMSAAFAKPLLDEAAVNAALDRAEAADPASYAARITDDQGTLSITRNGKPFAAYRCFMQDSRMYWGELAGRPKVDRAQIPIREYIRSR